MLFCKYLKFGRNIAVLNGKSKTSFYLYSSLTANRKYPVVRYFLHISEGLSRFKYLFPS